jgi:hypothetical protein
MPDDKLLNDDVDDYYEPERCFTLSLEDDVYSHGHLGLKSQVTKTLIHPGYINHFSRFKEKTEVISKLGFWSKVKAGPRFNPQAYCSISRS